MISQINQSAARQNLAPQLMHLCWLDFGNFMLQTPALSLDPKKYLYLYALRSLSYTESH